MLMHSAFSSLAAAAIASVGGFTNSSRGCNCGLDNCYCGDGGVGVGPKRTDFKPERRPEVELVPCSSGGIDLNGCFPIGVGE